MQDSCPKLSCSSCAERESPTCAAGELAVAASQTAPLSGTEASQDLSLRRVRSRVAAAEVDASVRPITFLFKLLDFDALAKEDDFRDLMGGVLDC